MTILSDPCRMYNIIFRPKLSSSRAVGAENVVQPRGPRPLGMAYDIVHCDAIRYLAMAETGAWSNPWVTTMTRTTTAWDQVSDDLICCWLGGGFGCGDGVHENDSSSTTIPPPPASVPAPPPTTTETTSAETENVMVTVMTNAPPVDDADPEPVTTTATTTDVPAPAPEPEPAPTTTDGAATTLMDAATTTASPRRQRYRGHIQCFVKGQYRGRIRILGKADDDETGQGSDDDAILLDWSDIAFWYSDVVNLTTFGHFRRYQPVTFELFDLPAHMREFMEMRRRRVRWTGLDMVRHRRRNCRHAVHVELLPLSSEDAASACVDDEDDEEKDELDITTTTTAAEPRHFPASS